MKTIKIFLASSEELKDERNTMADLILHLNKLFRGRGLELDLEKWEYLDASMTGKRKQDEYIEVLKQCDICMVLFWRKFGSFTGEELDTAYNRMKQKEKPHKIYVFFKNPNSDELTQELKDFIANYEQRFGGHFFCKFQNADTMKLEFLLQLENYQKDLIGEKAIEVRNEHVYVGNEAMVDLNNIPFAANNEGFQKRQAELKELHKVIAELQASLAKKQRKLERRKTDYEENPDDEDCLEDYQDAKEDVDKLTDELQKKLDRKNALEKEFEREQQNLFNTARRITEQRGQKISERMARAIEAFESGDAQRADVILDEAEKDADQALADIRIAKEVGLKSLEELIMKTSVKMSNNTIPIDIRINETLNIYEKADSLAQEINYDREKYIYFLFNYSRFLNDYVCYDKALETCFRLSDLCKDCYGKEHPDTALSYNLIGIVYNDLGKYSNALKYYQMALDIQERVLDKEHPNTASLYNNIGIVYSILGDYNKALDYHRLALGIWEEVLGKEHPKAAVSYMEIGNVYLDLGKYDKALIYFKQALDINVKILGKKHPDTAGSFMGIGSVYYYLGDYGKALEYFKQSLDIQEKILGKGHSDTAASYNNIGSLYQKIRKYDKALEYHQQALNIQEKVLGKEHPSTATSYNNIGNVYADLSDYGKALEFHLQALDIREKVLGKEHLDTASSYYNIGNVYAHLEDYDKALEWYTKAANQGCKYSYNELAWTYHLMGKYEEALPWAEKAVESFANDPDYIDTLASIYKDLRRYKEAMQQFELCLKLYKEQENAESIYRTEAKIAELKVLMNNGELSE